MEERGQGHGHGTAVRLNRTVGGQGNYCFLALIFRCVMPRRMQGVTEVQLCIAPSVRIWSPVVRILSGTPSSTKVPVQKKERKEVKLFGRVLLFATPRGFHTQLDEGPETP